MMKKLMSLRDKLAAKVGPRGGRIIGTTRSGKPIYESKDSKHYESFSKDDHHDAASVHANSWKSLYPKGDKKSKDRAKEHKYKAQDHANLSSGKYSGMQPLHEHSEKHGLHKTPEQFLKDKKLKEESAEARRQLNIDRATQ